MKFDLMDISGFETSGEAKQFAIDWQIWASKQSMSYGELAIYQLIEDGNKEFFKVWKPKPRKTPRKKSKKIKQ